MPVASREMIAESPPRTRVPPDLFQPEGVNLALSIRRALGAQRMWVVARGGIEGFEQLWIEGRTASSVIHPAGLAGVRIWIAGSIDLAIDMQRDAHRAMRSAGKRPNNRDVSRVAGFEVAERGE